MLMEIQEIDDELRISWTGHDEAALILYGLFRRLLQETPDRYEFLSAVQKTNGEFDLRRYEDVELYPSNDYSWLWDICMDYFEAIDDEYGLAVITGIRREEEKHGINVYELVEDQLDK